MVSLVPPNPEGGTPRKWGGGVLQPASQNPYPIYDQMCDSPYPIYDLTKNSIPHL